MLPAQDYMPEGGLGNLIALPLQGQALKKGNSAFIDEQWNVYPNQWQFLKETIKLSKTFIEEKIKEWTSDGLLGILADDMSGKTEIGENEKSKPWEKKKQNCLPLRYQIYRKCCYKILPNRSRPLHNQRNGLLRLGSSEK